MVLQGEYYNQPPSYGRVDAGLEALCAAHPGLCRRFVIGHSVLGREIYAVAVGAVYGAALFVGGTHGQEWLSTSLLIYFLDDLLNSIAQNTDFADIDMKKALAARGLVAVPALNPDGIEIALYGARCGREGKVHTESVCAERGAAKEGTEGTDAENMRTARGAEDAENISVQNENDGGGGAGGYCAENENENAVNPGESGAEKAGGVCCEELARWQANARGVDINHNFNAGWHVLRELEKAAGITGPAPTRYGGECPESEPETRAICRLCREYNIMRGYSFHSQGEEIYYKYGANTPPLSHLMACLLAQSSGYRVALPRGLAGHGGFKDWFIDELHRPAFTLEIGKGANPLPISELIPVYNKLREALALGVIM